MLVFQTFKQTNSFGRKIKTAETFIVFNSKAVLKFKWSIL